MRTVADRPVGDGSAREQLPVVAFLPKAEHNFVVANQEPLRPQHELVEDLLGVAGSFSYWLCGLRRYEKELERSDLTMEGDR
ncbi:hypothetical protein GCM10027452_40370 [Micromonospora halotolerans]